MSPDYRPTLPDRPSRMLALPLDDKGYPVPWFAGLVDGKPDLRIFDPGKLVRAVKESRCWICGDTLGKYRASPVGPMCTINLISAEPPSHRECAEYSLRACPFLTLPTAQRRDSNLPPGTGSAGVMVPDNPGVVALWVSRTSIPQRVDNGILFRLGSPTDVTWWTCGRPATRQEVEAASSAALERLLKLSHTSDARAIQALEARAVEVRRWWPREGGA